MALTHSTEEMFVNLEYATNYGGRLAGRADAVANVGKLLTGQYTEDQLTSIHEEVLSTDAGHPENDHSVYIRGYEEAWDVLFNLVYGAEPKNLANHLGPMKTTK